MSLNMDFSKFVGHRVDDLAWTPSPNGEVDRKKLERKGGESGWATSLVKFPPGSRFPMHRHPEGEEFLILDGVFSDEDGHHPKGSYVRNPPGSSHAPYSEGGCTLFVKLCQMDPNEKDKLAVDLLPLWKKPETLLYQDGRGEVVRLLHLDAGAGLQLSGHEILVLEGEMVVGNKTFPALSWLRFPNGQLRTSHTTAPSTLWIKSMGSQVQ